MSYELFCSIDQYHSLAFNQRLSKFNNQVYSNDAFALWPVYSGERFRFRASWPSCLFSDALAGPRSAVGKAPDS